MLVLFGLSLFFVLLEMGLQLSGFIILSLQEYRNRQTIRQKGIYRILCLGESTTQNQYPFFLEKILNQRNIGTRFGVIDKGIGGTNSSLILRQVESYLDKFHPDMVVVMMGINDWGAHIPYGPPSSSMTLRFLRSFKIYKLLQILWLHMVTKAQEIKLLLLKQSGCFFSKYKPNVPTVGLKEAPVEQTQDVNLEHPLKRPLKLNPADDQECLKLGRFYYDQGQLSQAEEYYKKALELNPKNEETYVELGWLYYDQGQSFQAEEYYKKALELNPKDEGVYVGLGWFYRDQGQLFHQAEEYYKKALELNPKNEETYVKLGRLYYDQGQPLQAEECYKKALELNPKNEETYVKLGRLYRDQGQSLQAEEYYKKALELNPKNEETYVKLGRLYYDQGQSLQAEECYKKALELNPKNEETYAGLGWLYHDQGQLFQAKECFEKGLEFNPFSAKLYEALMVVYKTAGQVTRAQEYYNKANELELSWYKFMTVRNYHTLKKILNRRKMRLVCVQYPMRSIEPLKKIFQDNIDGIIFVDNEKSFKEVVSKSSYKEYFRDMFAGNFGHCTPKGSRLLAGNIANTILKEVFHK